MQNNKANASTTQVHRPDGAHLNVLHFPSTGGAALGHVLILHGYLEHAARYSELAHHLCAQGFDVWAYDMRGHGLSSGQRGFVRSFVDYVNDAESVLALLPKDAKRFALAHSHGALVVLEWLFNRSPSFAGLVLTNPYLGLAHPAPAPKVLAGKIAGRVLPWLSLPAGLTAEQMTHDPELILAHKQDALIIHNANARWFIEASAAQKRILAQHQLRIPLLYVYSDSDPVASPALNRAYAEKLQSPQKKIVVRKNELHEVLNETNRRDLHAQVGQWLQDTAR